MYIIITNDEQEVEALSELTAKLHATAFMLDDRTIKILDSKTGKSCTERLLGEDNASN